MAWARDVDALRQQQREHPGVGDGLGRVSRCGAHYLSSRCGLAAPPSQAQDAGVSIGPC